MYVYEFKNKHLKGITTIPLFLTGISNLPEPSIWIAGNEVTRFHLYLLHAWKRSKKVVLLHGSEYVLTQEAMLCHYGIHEAPEPDVVQIEDWSNLSFEIQNKLKQWILYDNDKDYVRIIEETFVTKLGKITVDSTVFVKDGFYMSLYIARLNNLMV